MDSRDTKKSKNIGKLKEYCFQICLETHWTKPGSCILEVNTATVAPSSASPPLTSAPSSSALLEDDVHSHHNNSQSNGCEGCKLDGDCLGISRCCMESSADTADQCYNTCQEPKDLLDWAAPSPPGPPVDLRQGATYLVNGSLHIFITWSAAHSDLPVTRYKVFWSRRLGVNGSIPRDNVAHQQIVPKGKTSFLLPELERDAIYYIQVVAFSNYGLDRLRGEPADLILDTSSHIRPESVLLSRVAALHPGTPYYKKGQLRVPITWRRQIWQDETAGVMGPVLQRYVLRWRKHHCMGQTHSSDEEDGEDGRQTWQLAGTTYNTEFELSSLEWQCSYRVEVRPVTATGRVGEAAWTTVSTPPCSRVTIKGKERPKCHISQEPPLQADYQVVTGLFGLKELKQPEGFYLLKENAIADTERLVAECCNPNRSRKMVEVFDELSDALCRVADLAEFVRIAHTDSKFSRAAEDACVTVSNLVERLNTDRSIYDSLKHVIEHGDCVPTTNLDTHVSKLFQFDFEQSGIHLPDKQRERVVQLNEMMLYFGQRFSADAHAPQRVPRDKIPPSIRQYFSTDGNFATIYGLYSDSPHDIVREAAYKLYLQPWPEQESVLQNLLDNRHELAQLCGFPTYADRVLKGSLATSPALVSDFLDLLRDQLEPRAAADYNAMRDLKKRHCSYAKELSSWDTAFLTSLSRRQIMQHVEEDLSAYFSLGACMEGLNMLFQSLYGIKIELAEMESGESWHSDVYKLAVVHEEEGLLGHIYCDFFERPGKPNQDCHFTIVGGKLLPDNTYQNPMVVLMLNLPATFSGIPPLLNPGMADNLFHEMGHAMHSMLARTQYQHVTGTRCATDLAEVPSVLMEFFASDPRVLSQFARHYRTGEPLNETQLNALCASKHVFGAAEMQQQVFYSSLDQTLHTKHPSGESTTQVLEQVQKAYYGLPYVPNTAWQLRFSHLVGYGAKYYSYLMSRAVAAWIWHEYFQKDPLSNASGQAYRHEFLAHGGGVPPRLLLQKFLGKEPSASNLVSSLISDLDEKSQISR
nr:EOG090X02LQ [Lepidurus arcticus]